MKEKCLALFNNNFNCVLVGKKDGKEITYTGETPLQVLGDLTWDGLISEKYYNYIEEKAKEHLKKPTYYEKTMWENAKGDKNMKLDKDAIRMLACWIEDKYKSKDVSKIIRKFCLLDEFYLKFTGKEDKIMTCIEEGKSYAR